MFKKKLLRVVLVRSLQDEAKSCIYSEYDSERWQLTLNKSWTHDLWVDVTTWMPIGSYMASIWWHPCGNIYGSIWVFPDGTLCKNGLNCSLKQIWSFFARKMRSFRLEATFLSIFMLPAIRDWWEFFLNLELL